MHRTHKAMTRPYYERLQLTAKAVMGHVHAHRYTYYNSYETINNKT